MNGNHELTAKQLRVISHLLAAPSIEEGCKRPALVPTDNSEIPYRPPFLGSPLAISPTFNLAIDK